MKPTRPALRYFGGKWRIGKWIISHLPKDHCTYVEPFGGGASVLLQKPPSYLEVYNDIDGEVVNFFRVLRQQEEELIRAIRLTAFSREEYDRSFEPAEEPLERARRLYIKSFQSYASHTDRKSGWRWEKGRKSGRSSVGSWSDGGEHLHQVVARMRAVQIEHDDIYKILDRYDSPETLFYLDPPYIEDTLASKHRYKHSYTVADHKALLKKIKALEGMVAISMLSHPLYHECLSSWILQTKEQVTQNGNFNTEHLWISPNATRNNAQKVMF